jgi:hypothetical protein
MLSMKETVTSVELHEQTMRTTEKFNLNLNKLYEMTTDETLDMTWKKDGLSAQTAEEM